MVILDSDFQSAINQQSTLTNQQSQRNIMATDVVMPQMGESIAEGTIVRWIKKVGEKVDRDEPLFEISTDKVDAEIPSPAAGVVSEIRVKEGETVPVNTVVALIGPTSAGAPAQSATAGKEVSAKAAEPPQAQPQADGSPSATAPASAPEPEVGPAARQTPQAPPPHYHERDDHDAPASAAQPGAASARQAESTPARPSGRALHVVGAGLQAGPSTEETIRERSSPLVRKIAKEHNVDITQIHGTGIAGRVTKDDILGFLGHAGQGGQVGQVGQVGRTASAVTPQAASQAPVPAAPVFKPGASDQVEKMSVMRKRIAEHMVLSRRTSAHVHSVFEINFSRIAQIREKKKGELERAGAKLTYMSFIIKAAVDALRAVPIVNASVDGDNIVYHRDINIGVAVALDWGLIVPVIKHADEKNLIGLSRAVADLANRARSRQLKPDEVAGGTFTITNPGVFGALFGMPIINQPQVAILGVGNVEKRPVVVDDAIAIRPMAYLTLGYDHRVIDGAVADHFMSHLKQTLENWDPNSV
jgi:pyruvate dehydrogenase E2 component (dihydrolipoamide acetyltransferase)